MHKAIYGVCASAVLRCVEPYDDDGQVYLDAKLLLSLFGQLHGGALARALASTHNLGLAFKLLITD